MATRNPSQQDRSLLHRTLHDATKNNSIEKLQEALKLSKEMSSPNDPHQDFINSAVFSCLWDGSAPLLKYMIEEERADVTSLSRLAVSKSPSIPLLEILVQNGWDVNAQARRGPTGRARRLIDGVCNNHELVVWLVEHGARVDRGEDEYEIFPQPALLLETCAATGSLSTFKYLQGKGARLSRRTLHRCALRAAAVGANPALEDGGASKPKGIEGSEVERRVRSEMLRYLVDELKLEVNAMDTDIEFHTFHKGTPVCYAASTEKGEAVVRWLLSKGADPRIRNKETYSDAEQIALSENYLNIVEVIREWKRQQESS